MATIRTAIQINDMMSQQFRAMNMAMATVIDSFQTLQDTTGKAIDVSALNAAQQELRQVEAHYNQIEDEIRQADEAQRQLNNDIRNGADVTNGLLGKIMGIGAAYLSFRGIIGLADEMTNIAARLDLVNDGLQTTAELQNMIFQSAQRSFAPYNQMADLVGKLSMNAQDAFSSNAEVIAFAELLNKQFAIAGTSQDGIAAATLQLTQALGAGVLRGEELNSVFEQSPNIIHTIADYLEVPIGRIREMAAEGQITADVVKAAMFAAADDINQKFDSMPMTYAQVWNVLMNTLLQTFEPLIQAIGRGAQFIYDNWSTLEPIFWGLTAAVLAYAAGLGIQTVYTWIATGAAQIFFATLMKNPFFWIAIALGVLIGAIYRWIQAVGGMRIAWMIVVDRVLTGLDWLKYGFFVGIHWILTLFDKMSIGMKAASTGIMNIMGAMKANVLMQLQDLVNGSINIINGFINTLNKLPGVSIDAIQHVTFGTTAQLEAEARRQARNAEFEAYRESVNADIAARQADLENMKAEIRDATARRQAEILAAQEAKASETQGHDLASLLAKTDALGHLGEIAKNTGKMADSLDFTEEDIKYLRDLAAQEAINKFTTAEINIEMNNENHIASDMDLDGIIEKIVVGVEESIDSLPEGV